MRNKLKERLPKINFILGGVLFLLSSFSFYGDGKLTHAVLFLLLGLLNLLLIRFAFGNRRWVNPVVLGLNVLGAIAVALDYQSRGTEGLHLMWWFIAILYLIATVVTIRKQSSPASGEAP